MIMAFVKLAKKSDSSSFADEASARDTLLLKTMHLLAQDYQGEVNFSFVVQDWNTDHLPETYNIDLFDSENKHALFLI